MKKRIVIKLGTGVLSTPTGKSLDADQFTRLAAEIAQLELRLEDLEETEAEHQAARPAVPDPAGSDPAAPAPVGAETVWSAQPERLRAATPPSPASVAPAAP
jgi:hypothetical protein